MQRSRKKTVLQIEDVPKDAIILWTSTGSPLEVKSTLDSLGFENISYLALCKYTQLDLVEPPFIMDFKKDFQEHFEEYQEVYNLLEDERSREIFTKIMNFKISFDYTFMEGFTNKHEEQYFDKEILPSFEKISFLDGGGYVGDTTKELIKNYPDYKKIWLIEPIDENITIAKRKLVQYEKIEYINAGLLNREEELSFHEEKSFSSMFGKGTQSVRVNTIDNLIKEPIDYIKLDIEGAELLAIEGARESILNYHPVLAICIYHKAEDWYKVAQNVLAIEPRYKLYLRHYMEGIFESVLYFIPTSQPFKAESL